MSFFPTVQEHKVVQKENIAGNVTSFDGIAVIEEKNFLGWENVLACITNSPHFYQLYQRVSLAAAADFC